VNQSSPDRVAASPSRRTFGVKHPAFRVLLAALLFGAATPAQKPLLGHLDVVLLAAFLYLGAALGVSPISLRHGVRLPADKPDLRRLFMAILLGGVLAPVALLLGLRLAAAASVSLWLNLEVVATAIVGALFFHDRLGRRGWLAIGGVVIAGVILALGESRAGILAGCFVALACLGWGFDNQLTSVIASLNPAQTTFWKGLLAGLFNLCLALVLGVTKLDWSAAGLAVLVGAFCYGVSIALYIGGAREMGASRAQLVFAGAPFFGLFFSVLFLGEALAPHYLFAMLCFGVSLFVLFRERHEHRHTHAALVHTHAHRHDDGHHTHRHPGLPAGLRHSHPHEHEAMTHAHPHWPDLHHRHEHETGES
jgi:drug/metabolite transporter (DMT)-like permease